MEYMYIIFDICNHIGTVSMLYVLTMQNEHTISLLSNYLLAKLYFGKYLLQDILNNIFVSKNTCILTCQMYIKSTIDDTTELSVDNIRMRSEFNQNTWKLIFVSHIVELDFV